VNVPLTPGRRTTTSLFIYRKLLAPIAAAFKPEFILVSAGFDIFAGDPLGGMEVSTEGFGALAGELMKLAGQTARDRLLLTLEGGYNLFGLQDGVVSVLRMPEQPNAGNRPGRAQPVGLSRTGAFSIFKAQKAFWPYQASGVAPLSASSPARGEDHLGADCPSEGQSSPFEDKWSLKTASHQGEALACFLLY